MSAANLENSAIEREKSPIVSRGFTLVEVLVGATIAIVGLYASLALTLSALRGTTERRDAAMGEHLAEHMLATIQADAVRWVSDKPYGTYLKDMPFPAVLGQGMPWTAAKSQGFSADKRVGAMGADSVHYDDGILQEFPVDRGTRFCAWWRLIWVTPELIRAETRVAWTRPQVVADKYNKCPIEMAYDVGNVGSVTLPAMVMKNVYAQ